MLSEPQNNPLTYDESVCHEQIIAETPELAISSVSNSPNTGLIKFSHGGTRPGAGRKPTPTPTRPPIGMRWYVAETEHQKIHSAVRAILQGDELCKRKGYNAFLPTSPVRVKALKAGQAHVIVHRPMFYQFLFVEIDIDNDDWAAIRYADGVKRLLMSAAQRPVPVPRGFVERLIETAPERLNLPDNSMVCLKPDTMVLIGRGAFAGNTGAVKACDGYVTTVVLQLFGRAVPTPIRRVDIADE